jgi:hypothetical protein
MIDWGMVAGLAIAVTITVILWWLARRARRHPIEEGL